MNQDNYVCSGSFRNLATEPTESYRSGVLYSEEPSVIGVFDGMGGEERGEVASLIAAETAAASKIGDDPAKDLSSICFAANEKVCRFMKENSLSCSGTTAAMMAFTKKEIYLCNIGDSKIFMLNRKRLQQISFDHVAAGVFGNKPPLSQNIGIPPEELIIEPYLSKGYYKIGDVFLISSDGLTDMVTNERIEEILNEHDNIETAAKKLLEEALENGGKDNTTIILCKINKKRRS